MTSCIMPRKAHFPTEEEAQRRLAEITEHPDPWRKKNPHRYYECPCGGGFPLTSKDEDPEPEPEPLRIPGPPRTQLEKRRRRHRR
jgi:hypothetical protein